MNAVRIDPDVRLPLVFLRRYLFSLSRRPVSASNSHFRSGRLAALHSLAAMYENRGDASLDRIAGKLRGLTAANLFRVAPDLEEELKALGTPTIPRDVLVTSESPGPEFLSGVKRILIVFGPGIGIGDEIICFPVPMWLQRATGGVEITVLSAYIELWDRVDGISERRVYTTSREMIEALRSSDADLVMMIDFENPGLTAAVCGEPGIPRYAEIAIGSRSASVLTKSHKQLHRTPLFGSYFLNFYHCLDHLMRWFGLEPRKGDRARVVRRDDAAPRQEFTILVSPFTSKYNPSQNYWRRLLAAVVPPLRDRPFVFLIEPGPNQMTEAFTLELARAAQMDVPHSVRFEVAKPSGRVVGLADIFAHLERSDMIIAPDSFLAHAAAVLSTTALITARDGVENWRVPDSQNFYFRTSDSLASVAASMRLLIQERSQSPSAVAFAARDRADCRQLIAASDRLAALLPGDSGQFLRNAWSDCYQAYCVAAGALPEWPPTFDALLNDLEYSNLFLPWPADGAPPHELRFHLRSRFEEWQNSNLWKYHAR